MGWFRHTEDPIDPPTPTPFTIHHSDDVIVRAEKIIRFLGYTGAVGNMVLDVYKILKAYDNLDKDIPIETGGTGFTYIGPKNKTYESPSKEGK